MRDALVDFAVRFRETAEHHALERVVGSMGSKPRPDGRLGDHRGFVDRITVNASRNTRERDRAELGVGGELERASVAVRKELALPFIAAAPDRPYGVDHVLRRKSKAFGHLRLARPSATEVSARRQELGSSSSMDRSVDPTAAQKARVRGVDDGVHVIGCDVVAHHLDVTLQIDRQKRNLPRAP